jgi:hypothetical protein
MQPVQPRLRPSNVASYAPFSAEDLQLFKAGSELFHFQPGVGRTKEGLLAFLSYRKEDEKKRSLDNPGCSFSPVLKFVQDIHQINMKKISREDARVQMKEAYEVIYQEYNYSLHWDIDANLTVKPLSSKWRQQHFDNMWIPRRAEMRAAQSQADANQLPEDEAC